VGILLTCLNREADEARNPQHMPQGEEAGRVMRQPMPESFIWQTFIVLIGSIIGTWTLCRLTGDCDEITPTKNMATASNALRKISGIRTFSIR
jgi:hypothetical protein